VCGENSLRITTAQRCCPFGGARESGNVTVTRNVRLTRSIFTSYSGQTVKDHVACILRSSVGSLEITPGHAGRT
jgi:hypothetical protein